MNIRSLIKNNLINLIILFTIVGFRIVMGIMFNPHDVNSTNKELMRNINIAMNVITVVAGLLWAAYTVFSNYMAIKEDSVENRRNLEEIKIRLRKAGNKKFYINERKALINAIESIESRLQYYDNMDRDSKIRELFLLTENQIIRNVTNATEYIETFDYYTGKDSGYVKGLCDDSQHLLDKFNKLVELSVTYDDTATDYDTREIDDMINALENMRKTGKARLGS